MLKTNSFRSLLLTILAFASILGVFTTASQAQTFSANVVIVAGDTMTGQDWQELINGELLANMMEAYFMPFDGLRFYTNKYIGYYWQNDTALQGGPWATEDSARGYWELGISLANEEASQRGLDLTFTYEYFQFTGDGSQDDPPQYFTGTVGLKRGNLPVSEWNGAIGDPTFTNSVDQVMPFGQLSHTENSARLRWDNQLIPPQAAGETQQQLNSLLNMLVSSLNANPLIAQFGMEWSYTSDLLPPAGQDDDGGTGGGNDDPVSAYFGANSVIDDNMRFVSWFGYFGASSFPWIFHYDLGWLYCHGDGGHNLWLWDGSDGMGWLWTSPDSYPYLWVTDKGNWMFYYTDTAGWFFDYGANEAVWVD